MAKWLYGITGSVSNPDTGNPVTPILTGSASYTIDQKGTFEFTVPANDTRIRSLCTIGKTIRLFLFDDETETERVLARGLIMSLSESIQGDERILTVSCADLLESLDRRLTTYGLQYEDRSLPNLIVSMFSKASITGWTIDSKGHNGSKLVPAVRFDNISAFEAVRRLCQQNGWHFRMSKIDTNAQVLLVLPDSVMVDQGVSLIGRSRLGADTPNDNQLTVLLDESESLLYSDTVDYTECATYWNSSYDTGVSTTSGVKYRFYVHKSVRYDSGDTAKYMDALYVNRNDSNGYVRRDNFLFAAQTVTPVDTGFCTKGSVVNAPIYAYEFEGNGSNFQFQISHPDSNCANNSSGQFDVYLYETDENDNSTAELLVQSITVESDLYPVANRVTAYGGGSGAALLTLEASTRTSPYTIVSDTQTGIGIDHPYIQDTSSQSTYGIIHVVYKNDDITPIDNSDTGIEAAANQLYDAAAKFLEKHATPQTTYKVTAYAPNQRIDVGTQVYLRFQGIGYDVLKNESVYLDIDDMLYVIGSTERFDGSTHLIDLTVSTVDKEPLSPEKILIDNLQKSQALSQNIRPSLTTAIFSTRDNIQSGSTYTKRAKFSLWLDDTWLAIYRITLKVHSDHMWSGNDHASGNPIFRIYEDTNNYPSTISMYINGTDVSSSYGGPWKSSSNTQWDDEFDITDDIVGASGGWQQRHSIEFSCTGLSGNIALPAYSTYNHVDASHGVIEATFNIMGTTQQRVTTTTT